MLEVLCDVARCSRPAPFRKEPWSRGGLPFGTRSRLPSRGPRLRKRTIRRIRFSTFASRSSFWGRPSSDSSCPDSSTAMDEAAPKDASGASIFLRTRPEPGGMRLRSERDPAWPYNLNPTPGNHSSLPGLSGSFVVSPRDADAPGFLKWGRLRYVGKHYLKFHDGPYWIRGGTDEPENFLGYAGFDRTRPKTPLCRARRRLACRRPGLGRRQRAGHYRRAQLARQAARQQHLFHDDERRRRRQGRLALDRSDRTAGKLQKRPSTFRHGQTETMGNRSQSRRAARDLPASRAQRELKTANKRELDEGELGPDRKLYYREMIARFGHHLALQWNLCEEYNLNFNFGPERIRAFADFLRAVDPYDHPITVHSAGNPVEQLRFTYRRSSVRNDVDPIGPTADPRKSTKAIRRETEKAGRPLPVSLDEFTLDRGQRRIAHSR